MHSIGRLAVYLVLLSFHTPACKSEKTNKSPARSAERKPPRFRAAMSTLPTCVPVLSLPTCIPGSLPDALTLYCCCMTASSASAETPLMTACKPAIYYLESPQQYYLEGPVVQPGTQTVQLKSVDGYRRTSCRRTPCCSNRSTSIKRSSSERPQKRPLSAADVVQIISVITLAIFRKFTQRIL